MAGQALNSSPKRVQPETGRRLTGANMSVLKVTCISRSESDPEGGIGGVGGEGFYHSADEAVASINSRAHQYWAEVNGESVWIEVGYDKDGAPYLKTENEEAPGVSFLGLDECAPPEQS